MSRGKCPPQLSHGRPIVTTLPRSLIRLSHDCGLDRAARAARVTFPRTSWLVKVCDFAEALSVSPRVLGPVLWVVPNLGTIPQE